MVWILTTVVFISFFSNTAFAFNCASIPNALWCYDQNLAVQCGFDQLCQQHNASVFNKNLTLTVFYETLCPFSISFIKEILYPIVYLNMSDFVQIEMVPYGNAKVLENGTTDCEHGPMECVVNIAEACMVKYIVDPLPIIHCIAAAANAKYGKYCLYTMTQSVFDEIFEQCSSDLNIKANIISSIKNCSISSEGVQLRDAKANRTGSAFPDQHQWIPWIAVNDISLAAINQLHLADVYSFFKSSQALTLPSGLCSWYRGSKQLPAFCRTLPAPLVAPSEETPGKGSMVLVSNSLAFFMFIFSIFL